MIMSGGDGRPPRNSLYPDFRVGGWTAVIAPGPSLGGLISVESLAFLFTVL